MKEKTCYLVADIYGCKKYYQSKKLEENIQKKLEYLIKKKRITHFISGLNAGIDLVVALKVLALKSIYDEIKLDCIVRYSDQYKRCPQYIKNDVDCIISQCTNHITLGNDYKHWEGVIKHMELCTEQATHVFAVSRQNRTNGRVKKVIAHAQENGKDVIILDTGSYL